VSGNGEKSVRVSRPSIGSYYAARRQRTDSWQHLKTLADEWSEEGPSAKLTKAVAAELEGLGRLEAYFAYPGHGVIERLRSFAGTGDVESFSRLSHFVVRMLVSHSYRMYLDQDETSSWPEPEENDLLPVHPGLVEDERPYFEVLVVDDLTTAEAGKLEERLRAFRSDEDDFVYDIVVVPSFEDALIGVLLNYHIQSVVVRYGFPLESRNRLAMLDRTLAKFNANRLEEGAVGLALGRAIQALRPELDLFLVTDAPVEKLAGKSGDCFSRVFYRQEDYRELHQSILKGIEKRFRTPFFSALREHSRRPTGVFHALPIARGKSVTNSHWIREMEEFFGPSLFMAESSATTGGLDSLLQPHGSLREAQDAASRAFGSEQTYFVTNGTSTANKIVLQALAGQGDIVLVARDCHQSHHYALALSGAFPDYLNPYPLTPFSFYGGVPLSEIKAELLRLRDAGKLSRVKVLLLTNCTFDGIVYNPEKVMEEVLAIHPDITFIWDEAWFAFATFTPVTRGRTAMDSARSLRRRFASLEYREKYQEWRATFDAQKGDEKWAGPLMADPDKAKIRVYATHSTHKTLTSFRQGSMIHIHDTEFERLAEESFHQAYLTHTSTSPNYPILASLDIGRRQVELEGYELVQSAIEIALILRERINSHPGIARFFRVLTPDDLVPAEYRPSGFSGYREARTDWKRMDRAWEEDEFCLDPTRLTLFVGAAGIEGDTVKRMLMEDYDIQVNKTSRNTVLFMTHIGTTRGAAAHLIEVLARMAEDLADTAGSENEHRAELRRRKVENLTENMPPLPNFSAFHRSFRDDPDSPTREGDLRTAFQLSNRPGTVYYFPMGPELFAAIDSGKELVSASFVTPYPPGFPVLVPGQVVSREIVEYLTAVDVTEIHGYDAELGLRLFKDDVRNAG
jgi:arginine decarboxylase